MRIHRSTPTANFAQVPNETLRDERLSYTARGVLCEILSCPDGWATTADAMSVRARRERGKAGEGRRVLRAVFAQLEACGYLKRVRGRGGRGRITTEMHIYDRPHTDVPDGGTSVPPGKTVILAGRTDDRPSGTPAVGTDVAASGMSVRPGQTGQAATDDHTGGTPVPPGQMDVSAGRTDVPPIGRRSTGVPVGGTSIQTLITNTPPTAGAGKPRRQRQPTGDVGDVVAAFADGATEAGLREPPSSLRARVGRQARQLLADGWQLSELAESARRMGATEYNDLAVQVRKDNAAANGNGSPNNRQQARDALFDRAAQRIAARREGAQ